MKFGVFSIPDTRRYSYGEATARDVIDWDLQVAKWADQYGISEMYFAEHYTFGLEASPAPDLMIAAAARSSSPPAARTSR
jgi:alkanesulfonate monooxygenase SsuD/methylene tetrahydromethanopterin reductase-like flavin-dependent oxidoreductase (luciferase family)